jgi:glycosyltransferase involved in cell wall biosynthesis
VTSVRGVAIGVPARNEAATIGAALGSILRAARGGLPAVVVVAADACDDETVSIARDRLDRLPPNIRGRVVELDARSAGVARQMACEEADRLLRRDVPQASARWLATTDADTMVPVDWISTHRRWARQGFDAVAGLVRVDVADPLVVPVRRMIDDELEDAEVGHAHVYGANLGVSADWWAAVGGFPMVRAHEDVRFVQRLRAAGARVAAVTDSVVVTSGRLNARAPLGFGATLAALTEVATIR